MAEKLIGIVRREGVEHLAAYFTPGMYTGGGHAERAWRAAVGADEQVSVLRDLDVVLWRRHVKEHRRDNPTACPQRGEVDLG